MKNALCVWFVISVSWIFSSAVQDAKYEIKDFSFSKEGNNFENADKACKGLHGSLAIIPDKEVHELVKNKIKELHGKENSPCYYIGFKNFEWIDGTSKYPPFISSWNKSKERASGCLCVYTAAFVDTLLPKLTNCIVNERFLCYTGGSDVLTAEPITKLEDKSLASNETAETYSYGGFVLLGFGILSGGGCFIASLMYCGRLSAQMEKIEAKRKSSRKSTSSSSDIDYDLLNAYASQLYGSTPTHSTSATNIYPKTKPAQPRTKKR